MVPNIARVEALVCASEHEAAWLERNLLEQRKPRWNRSRGGQEVPVYLRLTERSASAALSIVHEGTPDLDGRLFGPYLGGRQARLAVAGLHRVLPLAYAGDRLTGSERDMARARGVSQFGRSELVGAVAAVLDRDPDAVAAVRDRLVLPARRRCRRAALRTRGADPGRDRCRGVGSRGPVRHLAGTGPRGCLRLGGRRSGRLPGAGGSATRPGPSDPATNRRRRHSSSRRRSRGSTSPGATQSSPPD